MTEFDVDVEGDSCNSLAVFMTRISFKNCWMDRRGYIHHSKKKKKATFPIQSKRFII